MVDSGKVVIVAMEKVRAVSTPEKILIAASPKSVVTRTAIERIPAMARAAEDAGGSIAPKVVIAGATDQNVTTAPTFHVVVAVATIQVVVVEQAGWRRSSGFIPEIISG
ncbi:hypothetical protein D3C84_793440 [compost metagenome]